MFLLIKSLRDVKIVSAQDEAMSAGIRNQNMSGSVPELLYTPECSMNRRIVPGFDRAQSNRELCTPGNSEKLRAMLPQYRPAPDYDTAVQQKYQQVAALGESRYQQLLYSSQPEIPSANVSLLMKFLQKS
jgi:hypothetical protein